MIVGIERLQLPNWRKNKKTPNVPLTLLHEIREHGQVMPVIVRRCDNCNDKYEILSNPETWLALQRLALHDVEIVVRSDITQEEASSIYDNYQIKNPIAEALWFEAMLKEAEREEGDASITALAKRLGVSRSYVSHAIRILTLDPVIKEAIEIGALKTGHAKALLTIEDPNKRTLIAVQCIRQRWSVRHMENICRGSEKAMVNDQPVAKPKSADILSIERKLSEFIGCQACIDETSGKVIIDYRKNLDVLDGVLKTLGYKD